MSGRIPRAVLAAGILLVPQAGATDRVALLIENSEYGEQKLARSAEGLAQELGKLGFRIEREKNLSGKEIEAVLRAFLKRAPTNGTAVISFSGHGVSRLGKEERRWIGLQGVGAARDERSAERACYKLDRLGTIVGRESGAASHHFILDFEAANPALKAAVVPTATQLADVPAVESVHLDRNVASGLSALKTSMPAGRFRFAGEPGVREGRQAGERWANSIGMTFSWCPPGSFRMGIAPRKGRRYPDAEPVDVELTRGFWMATYELTQREYRAIRGKDPNRGSLRLHRNAPATNIGNGGPELAKKLTELERKEGRLSDGWRYDVPTEVEWEYACRAGTSTRFSFGEDEAKLAEHANFADGRLHAEDPRYHYAVRSADDGFGATLALVGSYEPNQWGIHDMHGNVSEVCRDVYVPRLSGGVDPLPVTEVKDGERVIRGGAWCSTPEYCQSGFRNSISTGNNSEKVAFQGVRLILKKGK